MKHRRALVSLLMLGTMATASSWAAETTEQVVKRHMAAFAKKDLEGTIADYADNAVLITPTATTKGKKAIHDLFAQLLGGPNPPSVNVTHDVYEGNIGYLVWTQDAGKPTEVRGSDTFAVQNGKIVSQTVAMVPKNQ